MKLNMFVAGAALVLASAVPLLASPSPASATQSKNGCSVTAIRPEWQPLSNGSKQVRGVAKVLCSANRTVNTWVGIYEADATSDDTVRAGAWQGAGTMRAGTTYYVRTGWVRCPNTEVGNEEVYTKAAINVNSQVSNTDSGRSSYQLSIAC